MRYVSNAVGNKNFASGKSDGISEDEIPGEWREIPKEETFNKYGDVAGKLKSALLKIMALLREFRFRKYRMWVFN